MTRSELIEKLSIEKKIGNTVAEKIITEIFKSMTDNLVSGKGLRSEALEVLQLGSMTATLLVIPGQVFR